MPRTAIVGRRIGENLAQIFPLRFSPHEDFDMPEGFVFQVNFPNIPDGTVLGILVPSRAINNLTENSLLGGLFLDLPFCFFPSGLGCGRKRVRQKIQNKGQQAAADEKGPSQSDWTHACGQKGHGFPMSGKVGQDV